MQHALMVEIIPGDMIAAASSGGDDDDDDDEWEGGLGFCSC